jgi:hypothetical protein
MPSTKTKIIKITKAIKFTNLQKMWSQGSKKGRFNNSKLQFFQQQKKTILKIKHHKEEIF